MSARECDNCPPRKNASKVIRILPKCNTKMTGQVIRRRQCLRCGWCWWTIEIRLDEYDEIIRKGECDE